MSEFERTESLHTHPEKNHIFSPRPYISGDAYHMAGDAEWKLGVAAEAQLHELEIAGTRLSEDEAGLSSVQRQQCEEEALSRYETAHSRYLSAVSFRSSETPLDYNFYLKLATVKAKLATHMKDQWAEDSLGSYDRRKLMFDTAIQCYDKAIELTDDTSLKGLICSFKVTLDLEQRYYGVAKNDIKEARQYATGDDKVATVVREQLDAQEEVVTEALQAKKSNDSERSDKIHSIAAPLFRIAIDEGMLVAA